MKLLPLALLLLTGVAWAEEPTPPEAPHQEWAEELAHESPQVRVRAAKRLRKLLDGEARPRFRWSDRWVDALRVSEGEVREVALELLAMVRPPKAHQTTTLDALVLVLRKDERGLNREVAARAIGTLGIYPARTVPILIPALADPVEGVRGQVVETLSGVDAKLTLVPLTRTLEHERPEARLAALVVLTTLGPKALTSLVPVRTLLEKDSDGEVRRQAARCLGRLGSPAVVSPLAKALAAKDQDLREVAALELGRLGPKAAPAVPTLIRALADRHWRVVLVTCATLVRIGPKAAPAIPALVTTLGHRIWNVRRAAAASLAGMDQAAVPALTVALTHDQRNVRQSAALALGLLGPKAAQAVPNLIALLQDEHRLVRRETATALGRMGAKAEAAVPALEDLRENDEDRAVRRAARTALGRIQPAR